MKVRIVPSTRDGRQQLLTSYIINDTLAVDAGALAVGLSHEEQLRLRSIIITHTHLDHIISLPLYITDLFDELREPVNLYTTAADFDALRTYIFNPRVWIDWSILKNEHTELLAWQPYESGRSFTVEGLRITPIPVSHTVLTHALLIEDDKSAVLFTSDTGTTERVWQVASDCPKLRAVYIDLSFPAALTELGRVSKHHSVTTLVEELERINPAAQVYCIHLKPVYRERIIAEVAALDQPRLVIPEIGRDYTF
ncbi:MAG: MBL fold metallo-hydrolase [Blastocatellia bacterium]